MCVYLNFAQRESDFVPDVHKKVHVFLLLACDLNLVITFEASRVVNSFSFMGIILFPYFNSMKGVKKTMASGNSRIRSSISPIWLQCSIRVYLNFALRKHGKLNNLLPQFFSCLHKPTSNRYLFILLYESRRWNFLLIVMFCSFPPFFFFFAQRVPCIFNHVTDAVKFIYQIIGQSNFVLRKLSYFPSLHKVLRNRLP